MTVMLRPEDFGAVGDGVADDATALQAVFDLAAAQASDPVRIVLTRRYAVGKTVHLRNWLSPIEVDGEGGAAIVSLLGNGAYAMRVTGGRASSTKLSQIVSTTLFGSTFIQVATPSVFADGDLVKIVNLVDPALNPYDQREQLVEARRVFADGTLTLSRPLAFPVNAGVTATAYRMEGMRADVAIRGLRFDGSRAGNSAGLYLSGVRNAVVEDLRFNDFPSATFAAVDLYGGRVRGVRSIRGGKGNVDITIGGTGLLAFDVLSEDSKGFGVCLSHIADADVSDVKAAAPYGRGLVLIAACGCRMVNLSSCRGRAAGATGLSVTSGSCHNVVSNVHAVGNAGCGVWLNGLRNDRNVFHGVMSLGNTPNLSYAPTDAGNIFSGVMDS